MPPLVKMQRYPYSKWMSDPLLQALISFVSIIIMLSFVYTCINTVKVITTEKERQLKVCSSPKLGVYQGWEKYRAGIESIVTFNNLGIILQILQMNDSLDPLDNSLDPLDSLGESLHLYQLHLMILQILQMIPYIIIQMIP